MSWDDILMRKRKKKNPIDRFLSFVELIPFHGCWEWMGATQHGYGIFFDGIKQVPAHRWSYEFFIGPISRKKLACHRCDNRSCVNPDHIFPGTHKMNSRDMVQKGRHYNVRKTHCIRGHLFDDQNTRFYKVKQKIYRNCKICLNLNT